MTLQALQAIVTKIQHIHDATPRLAWNTRLAQAIFAM
jgi:hypothetical protein